MRRSRRSPMMAVDSSGSNRPGNVGRRRAKQSPSTPLERHGSPSSRFGRRCARTVSRQTGTRRSRSRRNDMFPRIVVDELAVAKTTDSGPFNTADELYFALAGSTSQAQIEVPRVSPPPPQDYYGLGVNQRARDIKLWQGYVGQGHYAYLAVVLREQDNAQLGAIVDAVTGAALGIAAIFVDPALGPAALSKLKSAASTFVNSLSTDGDQNIGAFAVRVHNEGATLAVDWAPITAATLAAQTGLAATFDLTGSGAHDTVRVRVQQPRLPQVVNVHSGKCLDVVDASLADQAKVQQYPKKAEQ